MTDMAMERSIQTSCRAGEPSRRVAVPLTAVSLPVVCLSLGGTKLELGALTREGDYLSSREVHWRNLPRFRALLDDRDAWRFSRALLERVEVFLQRRGYDFRDVGVLGLPFPGPVWRGRWYSNNLIAAFRDGLPFEEEIGRALLARHPGGPRVRVLSDARCDAGGELYHPRGRLQGSTATATVLNLATGIAAGFVHRGRLLEEEQEYRTLVHPDYDTGAAQLGRHLWYHPHRGGWRYHFHPRGQAPDIPPPAVRMTERLSGPALAARLLLYLGRGGLLPRAGQWPFSQVDVRELHNLYHCLETHQIQSQPALAAQRLRASPRPVASVLLTWADGVYREGQGAVVDCIGAFAREIAGDLAGALTAWAQAPGWEPYARHVVLTGGAGIRFLSLSDGLLGKCFIAHLAGKLPDNWRVERSCLLGSAERESYLFLGELAGD
ncbi:MAG: hypothetical protein R3310_01780 [Candidatus Competibacteraceae bacterium]|nr:hypothetical protein [Candidatus Competibacteraceae bacterium]